MIAHCAVFCQTSLVSNEEAEFRVAALNAYVAEDVWPAWAEELGGGNPPNFVYYGRSTNLPQIGSTPAMLLMLTRSEIDWYGGYHSVLGRIPFGRTFEVGNIAPDRTFNHEGAEMTVNPYLDRWYDGPVGLKLAAEINDPVQADWYTKRVMLFGQWRAIEVPNFVTPAYFGRGKISAQFDHLNMLKRPFEVAQGGYQMAKNDRGDTVFLRREQASAMMFSVDKLSLASRTAQLLNGISIPRPGPGAPPAPAKP